MVYVIAWTPYSLVSLWGQFGPENTVTPLIAMIPNVLGKSSVLYNPIVYFFKDIKSVFSNCKILNFFSFLIIFYRDEIQIFRFRKALKKYILQQETLVETPTRLQFFGLRYRSKYLPIFFFQNQNKNKISTQNLSENPKSDLDSDFPEVALW